MDYLFSGHDPGLLEEGPSLREEMIETFSYLTSAKARSTKLRSSRRTVTLNVVLQNLEISYFLHINVKIPFV
jgi:hypothetical protein